MNKKILCEVTRIKEMMGLINEEVITNYDSKYDYKKEGDQYFAKRKNSEKWIKLSGESLSAVMTKVFGVGSSSSNDSTSPFKDKIEGDKFRNWVNDKYPSYAKSISLDRSGSYNNEYIKKAYSKYGNEYMKNKGNSSDNRNISNFVLSKTIDVDNIKIDTLNSDTISSNKKLKVLPTYKGDACAKFVNDFTKSRNYIGDAWCSHDIDNIGTRIFSIYTSINKNDIEKYKSIYTKIKNGKEGEANEDIKNFNKELLSRKGQPSNLNIDDVVGIFYEPSDNHVKAFNNAATPGLCEGSKGYFIDGDPSKPGNTLKNGRGFSFNTHVGIVGAIKDGKPIVFHNVHGTVYAQPADTLPITWVKRL